jgi:poly(3-hydroxybutyrate) depolymerase
MTFVNYRQGAKVICLMMEGLEHHWHCVAGHLPAFLVGPRAKHVDATALIWSFFQQHELDWDEN